MHFSLPVFETLRTSDNEDVKFVSLTEVKRGAPLSMPDIPIKVRVKSQKGQVKTGPKEAGVSPPFNIKKASILQYFTHLTTLSASIKFWKNRPLKKPWFSLAQPNLLSV